MSEDRCCINHVQQSVDMWYLRVVQDQKCLWRKTRHTACICPSYVDTVKQFVACLGRLPLQTLTLRTLISLLLAVEPSYSGANRHLLAKMFFQRVVKKEVRTLSFGDAFKDCWEKTKTGSVLIFLSLITNKVTCTKRRVDHLTVSRVELIRNLISCLLERALQIYLFEPHF